MFVLILITVVSMAALAAAGAMVECVMPYLPAFDEQTAALCNEFGALGLLSDPLVGLGAAIAVLLAAVFVWRSAFNRWMRLRRVETSGSLVNNMHRLVEDSPEPEEIERKPTEGHEIWERVDELEKTMRSASAAKGKAAPAWLELLRSANDMHSEGELSTEEFKVINSRLLDLVSRESDSNKFATTV